MKKDSKYNCLSSKEDVKKVVREIRKNKMKKKNGNLNSKIKDLHNSG